MPPNLDPTNLCPANIAAMRRDAEQRMAKDNEELETFKIPEGLRLAGNLMLPRGRDLRATRTFQPGDLIGRFEGPAVALPDSPSLKFTCSYCLRTDAEDVKACAACQGARYCSKRCQKADWALMHKRECKIFKRVKDEGRGVLPTPVRAIIQLMIRPDMANARKHLCISPFEKFSEDDLNDMELQAQAVLKYLDMQPTPGSFEESKRISEVMDLGFKLQVNSFNRKDEDTGDSGIFMNLALSMINHSCMPNAFVQFDGRQAILRANKVIHKDANIEISYIDNNLHKYYRFKTLKERWHFSCSCKRCKDDLDPHQAALEYPHLDLNALSLTPDFASTTPKPTMRVADFGARKLEEIYNACSAPIPTDPPSKYAEALRRRWQLCKPLRNAGLFAVEPVPEVLGQATIYLGEHRGDYAGSLAVSSFLVLRSDPFKSPMPFGAARLKGLLLMANLMSNTAPLSGSTSVSSSDASLKGRIAYALSRMDQATMTQAVLAIATYWAPRAHSEDWAIYHEAAAQLRDVEGLRGREKERVLIQRWVKDQTDQEAALFFDYAVLKPVQELAGFALEVMASEFGSDKA